MVEQLKKAARKTSTWRNQQLRAKMRQTERFDELSQYTKEKRAFRFLKSKQKLLLIDLENTLITKIPVESIETLRIL